MNQYELEEVMSGTEESCLWVTLGFSSEIEKHDVLHIVCATTVDAQDREGGMAGLYLERFDQAYCCYDGADSVLVTASSVEIHLNRAGCDALDFESGITLQVPAGLKGYSEAVTIFRRMATMECGKHIHVHKASP